MVIYQINPNVKQWLLNQIQLAGGYMIERTVKKVTADELFEALVPEQHWQLLREASAIMPPKNSQQSMVQLLNGIDELHSVNPKISATVGFHHAPASHLLLPNKLNPIKRESKLFEYLTPSLSLARDWATLFHVTKRLMEITDNDRNILANLFPWLPDVVRESGWIYIPDEDGENVDDARLSKRVRWYKDEIGVNNRSDRESCDRSFIAMLKSKAPAPALTGVVRDAVKSGSRLFTQYRLAKQDTSKEPYDATRQSTITPPMSDELMHPAIVKGLEDTKAIYQYEKNIGR